MTIVGLETLDRLLSTLGFVVQPSELHELPLDSEPLTDAMDISTRSLARLRGSRDDEGRLARFGRKTDVRQELGRLFTRRGSWSDMTVVDSDSFSLLLMVALRSCARTHP